MHFTIIANAATALLNASIEQAVVVWTCQLHWEFRTMGKDSNLSVQDREELRQFQQWLQSLSRRELLQAMQFTFQGTPSSHEYELLSEMVRLESPPPTPVHPRAMGYWPLMSQRGAQLDHPHGARVLLRTRPQLFQWTERQSYRARGARNQTCPKFDVIARRKVAPWGEVYSIGSTEEQRYADRILVDGTWVVHSKDVPSVLFRGNQSTSEILNILQVASRGYFKQAPAKSSLPFCSSWLQPTERWFSLSFYLASRYHVALWESYTGKSGISTCTDLQYEPRILARAVPAALKLGLLKALEQDGQNIKALRDSLVWGLLGESSLLKFDYCGVDIDWGGMHQSLKHTKLRDLVTPESRLKALVCTDLKDTLAAEMQKLIMEETLDTASSPPLSSKSKGKKKKKSKKKRRAQGTSTESGIPNNDDAGKEEAMATEPQRSVRILSPVHFPRNDTLPMERNRNIIIALSVLEEVMEAAFLKVGLEPTPPFVEAKPKPKAKNNEVITITMTKRKKEIPVQRKADSQEGNRNGVAPVLRGGMFAPSPFSPNFSQGLPWPPLTSNTLSAFQSFIPPPQPFHPSGFYQPIVPDEFAPGTSSIDESLEGWPFLNRFHAREESILSDFFQAQQMLIEIRDDGDDDDDDDDDEELMVASTAASVSSSTYKDPIVLAETDDMAKAVEEAGLETTGQIETIAEDAVDEDVDDDSPGQIETIEEDAVDEDIDDEDIDDEVEVVPASVSSGVTDPSESPSKRKIVPSTEGDSLAGDSDSHSIAGRDSPLLETPVSPTIPRSPSPQAPLTPPPTLSPILVSLADLRHLKRNLSLTPERAKAKQTKDIRSYSAVASGSLPSSPTPAQDNGLSSSWSRDDIRIKSFRDDLNIRPKRKVPQPQKSSSELQPSYRAAAVKSLARPIASSKATSLDFRSQVLAAVRREVPRDSCARSETAVEAQREDPHWQGDFRKSEEFDNKSMTKDETTTITSAMSPREPEEIATLREERNTYRDMCLTLGAEVAKLKAMLAAQQATAVVQPFEFQDPFGHPIYQPSSFDPQGMQPFYYGNKRGQRLGPMSDAGLHRAGDHESQISEDDNFDLSKSRMEAIRQISSSATLVGSDASVDFNNSNSALQSGPISSMPVYDSMPVHGLQSRLTKDIMRFLDSISAQLKKQDGKRQTAVERFSRLVTAIWPRAQVKLYGSHVSGLCLPSSDLDFVVCLPAVHKRAPALAPGVLEGRNAINESSQKLLARELKGESWIDPRSIKLIERTVVPVIKVSTKDTRARVLQLDISFDSPEHHGLEANAMVTQILEELPLIRPLMLILKQFLLDRGLLTAYTGGLSSYCLFLMVARYLQEQPRSIGDCGSLLMGFLDFYGNCFDPRATGISVRRRQYFMRPTNYRPGSFPVAGQPLLWPPAMQPSPQHVTAPSPNSLGPHDFLRRNSFSSDTGSVDGGRRGHRPPRFQTGPVAAHRYSKPPKPVPPPAPANNAGTYDQNFGHGRPFTFDPLFVEDPLSSGNNVGRNAFRIFQVQRAFSDAHRALVASLEWDIHSSGELNEGVESYPLLKCLLQTEDVLYEL